jgi:hypothetical protein
MTQIFSSFKKKSYIPFTKGSSGPTTIIFNLLSKNKHFYGLKISDADIGLFVAIAAVPAFPGATKVVVKVDFESFSMQMHCSLPPEPKSKLSSVVLFSCSSAFWRMLQNNCF